LKKEEASSKKELRKQKVDLKERTKAGRSKKCMLCFLGFFLQWVRYRTCPKHI
jgi:hypothetical protein